MLRLMPPPMLPPCSSSCVAKRLVALAHIQHGYIRYKPGDTLPAADMARALEWLAAGSAKMVDDDTGQTIFPKAKQAAALPGLPGTAVGGEQTGDDLAGRVPLTKERMTR